MSLYTISLVDNGAGDVPSGNITVLAKLSVATGRGPKGDGFTGVTYDSGTGQLTFTSNDGIESTTGDIRGFPSSSPGPIGSATPNTGAFTTLSSTSDTTVGGNVVVTGTVDGRDVAVDGGKIDSIITDQGIGPSGGPVPNNNVDNIVNFGSYKIVSVTLSNSPALTGTGARSGSSISHFPYDGVNAGQLLFAHATGEIWTRINDGGVWSPFVRLFSTDDATQSIGDDNIGRLLKVGDNGLAQPSVSADADLNTLAGRTRFFSWGSSSGGSPSNGPSANGHAGLQISSSSFRQIQLAGMVQGGTNPKLYYRSQDTDWSPWVELFHKSNILGTVSHSAGIPTGAVIQRGSNANGEFVRFADGTQICTNNIIAALDVNTARGNIFHSASASWTFPVPFMNTEYVGVAFTPGASIRWAVFTSVSSTGGIVRQYAPLQSATVINTGAFVIGRWF